MGFSVKDLGGAISNPVGTISNLGSTVGGVLTGTSKDAGILGVGQFKGQAYDPNAAAFSNDQSKALQNQFAAQLAAVNAREMNGGRVQAAQIATAPQDQFRQGQTGLMNTLQDQMAGQGPSLAQSQLRQATDRNIAQAIAMQASQRGGSPGVGMRQIAQSAAAANQQAAGQSADLRAQEQMAAQQQLAGLTAQGRTQDIGLAQGQAELSQQAAIQNQNANLQQTNLNDQMARFYNQNIAGMTDQDRQAQIALEQMKAQQALGVMGVDQKAYSDTSKARGDVMGNLGGGIASLAQGGGAGALAGMFSDKNLKKDIKDGKEDIKAFLNELKAYSYKYKNPEHGEGDYVTPMAQDIEKTALGKNLIIETPEGKMVNYAKAGGTMLGAAAMLNDRMNDMESKLKKAFAKRG